MSLARFAELISDECEVSQLPIFIRELEIMPEEVESSLQNLRQQILLKEKKETNKQSVQEGGEENTKTNTANGKDT